MNTLEILKPHAVIHVSVGLDCNDSRMDREARFNNMRNMFNEIMFEMVPDLFVELRPVFTKNGINTVTEVSGELGHILGIVDYAFDTCMRDAYDKFEEIVDAV